MRLYLFGGSLYLVTEDGDGDQRRRYLGEIDDPATSYEVPEDLLEDYACLLDGYLDGVRAGVAYQQEARTYR